ncbi:MAG: SDR family oxidoreductase [Deltaproteobacteria bacterium]|nr:SDR family oxidoreductase [Deltaproteobacteria bacterium]
MNDRILMTGASGFIGSRLARALAARGARLTLLCRPGSRGRLESRLGSWPEGIERPEIVLGDLSWPGVLSDPQDVGRLSGSVTGIFHLGAVYHLGVDAKTAASINVRGTERLLELAHHLGRLRRFHHVSTIAVSGDASGTFYEQDLDRGQGFPHAYAHSKFLAELALRQSGLPCSIYRPGIVVGDSRSGEFDKIDGPYYLLRILSQLRRLPGARRMPMIAPREQAPLFHLVPVDYVVEAMAHLAMRDEGEACATYHLTDPEPESFRSFYIACLREMGFRGPIVSRPTRRFFRLLMLPGLRELVRLGGRAFGMPAEMLAHVLIDVCYDTARTREALAGTGLVCPRVLTYLPQLVRTFEAETA